VYGEIELGVLVTYLRRRVYILLNLIFFTLISLGFFFQTSQDKGSFCSFAISSLKNEDAYKTFRCILINSDLDISALFSSIDHLSYDWISTDLPMIVVPLAFLKHHVQQTSAELLVLISHIEEVEKMIVIGSDEINFEMLIKRLHSCNSQLVKLQRRWHFEPELASLITEFVNNFEKTKPYSPQIHIQDLSMDEGRQCYIRINGPSTPERSISSGLRKGKYFRALESNVMLQMRLSMASEYDLNVFPRRITSQFTTVRSNIGTLIRYELMTIRYSI
jgi:hypothetical protein